MRFEFKILLPAACGSILLAPLLLDSIFTGRWPFTVLAFLSAYLIMRNSKSTENNANINTLFYWGLAVTLTLASYLFEIDKALYLAGATLIAGSFLHAVKRSMLVKTAALTCILAIVPIPAGLEAAVANILSNAEASIFVALGQLADQPLYQVGSQVILGKLAVTINSDCSGTLLLLPSFLGCLVGAATCQRGTSYKFFILLAALPLAITINLVRIAFLLCIGLYSPETPIDGIHDTLGWIAMSTAWVLPVYIFADHNAEENTPTSNNLLQTLALLSVVLVISFILNLSTSTHDQTDRAPLPLYVGGWVGENQPIPPEELRILNADSAVRRQYTNPNGDRTIFVTEIFHYNTSDAEQHNSAACFRAMGWQAIVLSHEKLTAASTLEHLLVRNHVGQQAVLEVTLNMNRMHRNDGHIRLQIVEASTVPEHERRNTALIFLKAAQKTRSNET